MDEDGKKWKVMLPDHLCVWRKEKITESFQHKNIGEDHSWSKAMALTYTELTTLVRNWCNRDADVVSDAIIKDCLKYAADKAYRTLRVPPLENVVTYEVCKIKCQVVLLRS